jgi:CRP-like cAMP-binding protein
MRKALYVMGILDDSDVQWMSSRGQRSHVTAGTVLIREGTPIESMYILLDGKLSVTIDALKGKEVAALYAGEIVGEISFVDSSPPSASVVAARDSNVLAIRRDMLEAKLGSDLGFASRFYRAIAMFLAGRLRMTTSRLGYGSAQQDAADPDELDDESMDNISLAARRFDDLLREQSSVS